MSPGARRRVSAAEWVTLGFSAMIVGALVVLALVAESRREDAEAADLRMTFDVERAETRGETHFVPYTIRNAGSTAISSAEIWIDIFFEGALVDSAEVNVQFLPLQGRQDGVFVTSYDPDTHTVVGRVESLQFP